MNFQNSHFNRFCPLPARSYPSLRKWQTSRVIRKKALRQADLLINVTFCFHQGFFHFNDRGLLLCLLYYFPFYVLAFVFALLFLLAFSSHILEWAFWNNHTISRVEVSTLRKPQPVLISFLIFSDQSKSRSFVRPLAGRSVFFLWEIFSQYQCMKLIMNNKLWSVRGGLHER